VVRQPDGEALSEPTRVAVVRRLLEVAPLAGLDAPCRVAARGLRAPAAITVIVGAPDVHVVGYGGVSGKGGSWDDEQGRATVAGAICPSIAAQGSPVAVQDTRASIDSGTDGVAAEAGVLAYAGAPIHDSEGHVVGVFCALEPHPRKWSEDDIALVAEFAASLGSRLQLAVTLRDNAVAAEAAEREHRFLELLLETLDVGVSAVDADGRVVVINRKLREAFGAPPSEPSTPDSFRQQHHLRVLDADGRTELGPDATPLARALAGETVVGAEVVVAQDDAPRRRLLADAQPLLLPDGTKYGAVTTSYDITARRRTELLTDLRGDAAGILSGESGDAGAETAVIERVLEQLHSRLDWSDSVQLWWPGEQPESSIERELVARARADHRTVWHHDGTSTLAVPLISGPACLGVLTVTGTVAEEPDAELTTTLEAVAGHLARHLEHGRAEQLAAELSAEREHFYRAISGVSDYVWTVEVIAEGHVEMRYESPNIESVLGGPLPNTKANVNAVVQPMFHPDDAEVNDEFQRRIARGEPAEMEVRMTGVDGVERWLWIRGRPRREGGRLYFDGVTTNVTVRRQLAEAREESLRQQQLLNRELLELDRMKSEFTAAIGHELRTPITVIQGYGALLASKGGLEGKALEWATAIERRCADVQKLLADFLDLSKFDAGVALPEQRRQVDIDPLVAEVIRDHAQGAEDSQVVIRPHLEAQAAVPADPRRLRQVVDNLVSNAVKYSDPDGVVFVSTTIGDGTVVLTVQDEGIGVDELELSHLFDRFFRAQNARERDSDGTGLGLAVSREIVRAHGGMITGMRNEGRGMRFTVTLPAHSHQDVGSDSPAGSSSSRMS
jgi:PAS domain S-box-containing protein